MEMAILNAAILAMLFVIVILLVLSERKLVKKKDPLGKVYKVKIGFVNSQMRLTLNPEQYEHLETILNQKEGYFQIGDEFDIVRIYRESICWVKVKQK